MRRKRERSSFSSSINSGGEGYTPKEEQQELRKNFEEFWVPYNGAEADISCSTPGSDKDSGNLVEGENIMFQTLAIEDIPSRALVQYTRPRSSSRSPDLAMISPIALSSPLSEFRPPAFVEFSDMANRRVLIDHFCNVLSHLIVFQEDSGNPFRQLVLPLSHSSSAVMDAIFALSSAHLEHRGVQNKEMALTFHNKALKGISQLIEDPTSSREELLGAIILLVYYEVLVQRGNSNIVQNHLKGALTIINSSSEVLSPASVFLERAFRFYDVVAALSLGASPSASFQDRPILSHPSSTRTISSAQSKIHPLNQVDTLLGLSTDIWPIIHRLANLLSMKAALDEAKATGQLGKVFVLREELETTSHAIEIALTKWTPYALPIDHPYDADDDAELNEAAEVDSSTWSEPSVKKKQARLQGILSNAEAYRHSALIYLYRIIQCRSCENTHVQERVRLSLAACSNVVSNAEQCPDFSGPMAALLWPLFVASCEAITEADRATSQQIFFGIERRQGMRNIVRAWEVVQDIWQRRDLGETSVDWRDVCGEKGIQPIFG